jgi:carbon storage regulator
MLVLSREKGQSVIIGDREVEIFVIEIRGGKVRLGFKAHPSIEINRDEIYEEKRQAAGSDAD